MDAYQKWEADGELKANLLTVQSMAMEGHSIPKIADALGISERTLKTLKSKYPALSARFKKGRRHVVGVLQSKLMERVEAGDTTAIIYALKVFGGDFYKDRALQNVTVNTGEDVDEDNKTIIILPPGSDCMLNPDESE
jgi:transposase